MIDQQLWVRERFPVLYEGNKPKAVMVDVESFAVMETMMDNILNREAEPEDAILVASGILKQLADQTQDEISSTDWEKELDEL